MQGNAGGARGQWRGMQLLERGHWRHREICAAKCEGLPAQRRIIGSPAASMRGKIFYKLMCATLKDKIMLDIVNHYTYNYPHQARDAPHIMR